MTAALAPVRAMLLAGLTTAALACEEKKPPSAAPPRVVSVTKVGVRDVDVEVKSPIELRAIAEVDIGSKALGYLESVLVEQGDRVTRGQSLAVVRPSDLPEQLDIARGSLAQAQAASVYARQNLDRNAQLARVGAISTQDYQLAQAELRRAAAQEAAASAQVGGAAVKLEEAKVTAPFDGVVTVRHLDPGALVGRPNGPPILSVARIDRLRAIVTVTERDAMRIRVGQLGHVNMDASSETTVFGQVIRVSPTVDPATRTRQAELQIANTSGTLLPGMYGRGAVVVDRHPAAIVVPSTAIQVVGGRSAAFVVVAEKVERREITIGVDEGTWLEVTGGLAFGDEVVVSGADSISDGSLVRPLRNIDPYSGVALAAPTTRGGEQPIR